MNYTITRRYCQYTVYKKRREYR